MATRPTVIEKVSFKGRNILVAIIKVVKKSTSNIAAIDWVSILHSMNDAHVKAFQNALY